MTLRLHIILLGRSVALGVLNFKFKFKAKSKSPGCGPRKEKFELGELGELGGRWPSGKSIAGGQVSCVALIAKCIHWPPAGCSLDNY